MVAGVLGSDEEAASDSRREFRSGGTRCGQGTPGGGRQPPRLHLRSRGQDRRTGSHDGKADDGGCGQPDTAEGRARGVAAFGQEVDGVDARELGVLQVLVVRRGGLLRIGTNALPPSSKYVAVSSR